MVSPCPMQRVVVR